MATIEKYQTATGTTRYMVCYRTPQHTQTKKPGFVTKRAAKELAATVEVEKLTGNYVAPSLGQVTIGELGKEWLARHRTIKPVGRRGWNRCGVSMSNRNGATVASLTFVKPRSKSGLPN
jgi:hypothetical protein